AAIRRQPVEAAIDAIRHDLGVCFSLCGARFGNALHDMAAAHRDTLATVFHPFPQRETAVADAPARNATFALPPQKPDAIRYILGCLGAQQPVCGFPVMASPLGVATAGAQPP
ncbi:MAG TPA: hypothetical protein VFN42_00175, partial [Acetobacteraceae bacterium]|nr:hypothetical protein [Acetobacteraceae bacterium]